MTSLKSNILLFVFKFQTGFPRPSDDVPQPAAHVQTLSSKMCSRIWTRTTSWYCSGVSLKQQKETFHWSIFLNWVQEAKYFNTANSVLRVHWLAVVVLNVKFMFWQWLVYWFLLQFILRFFTLLLRVFNEEGEMTIISVTYMYVVSLWQKGLCSLEDESMASSSTLQ